ncbi:Diacylglycerol kinase iota [Oryzias melastigma]|uniref:Diacylglycerol kinase iota n=1 Tax=Oryzias melastigma TaxID=30732 RepID=A0A834C3X9_ORYME|nr:Diacylglycerol kinase iota [Oryzias melastigma]
MVSDLVHVCVFAALLTAAVSGDLPTLSECVQRGVSLLVRDAEGCSALHIAAQNGHTDLVRYILQQGSKVLLDLTDREKGRRLQTKHRETLNSPPT